MFLNVRPEDSLAVELVAAMGARMIDPGRYELDGGGDHEIAVVSFTQGAMPKGVLHPRNKPTHYRILRRKGPLDSHVSPQLQGEVVLVLNRDQAEWLLGQVKNIRGQIRIGQTGKMYTR